MTTKSPLPAIITLCLPIAILLGLGAERAYYYGEISTALLAAALAIFVAAIAAFAIVARIMRPKPYEPAPPPLSHKPTTVGHGRGAGGEGHPYTALERRRRLELIKQNLRRTRPDIPAQLITSATTASELAANIVRWNRSHGRG
jgi:hypothetical protein